MTKRHSWFLKVALLVLMATLLTGCLWGSEKSSEKGIRVLISSVENAMIEQDAAKLANCFAYPLEMKFGEELLKFEDEEELTEFFVDSWEGENGEAPTLVEFNIDLDNAEIIIDKSGETAVIRKSTVSMTVVINDEKKTIDLTEIPEFEVKKEGKEWKLYNNFPFYG